MADKINDRSLTMSERIKLQDAYKQSTTDQDKTLPPGETVRVFKEKLAATGLRILERTVRIDTGRLDIPVYISYYGPDARRVGVPRKQMGKGATPEQAEASAVMELAERFSFFSYLKDSPKVRTAPLSGLESEAPPFEQIIQSVNDSSEDAERLKDFFAGLPLRWAPAFNLTRNRPVQVPIDWFHTINEFNGSCAGNCPEEAICQGISEVVERHVSAIVSRHKIAVPAIRISSLSDPVVLDMIEKYRKNGIQLFLSDFTLDTGVPTVGAMAWDPNTFPEKSEIVWTAGTTPNPQKALSRALTETAQLGGDFETESNYVASGLPKPPGIDTVDFITKPERHIDISALPDLSDNNIRIEIENLIAASAQHRMEVLVLDLTHPVLGIPAYYVMVPGAHFRERSENSSVGLFTAKLIAETLPPDTAELKLMEMSRILPGKYYVRFQLGALRLSLGDTESALDHFRAALDLDPAPEDAPSIYSYMGICLKEMERYEEALEVLRNGVALDADRTDLHNLMGFCLFKLKRHEEAIQAFESVLKIDPGSAIDHANIASNYRELGNRDMAIAHYRIALTMDPGIDFARDNLERLTGKAS